MEAHAMSETKGIDSPAEKIRRKARLAEERLKIVRLKEALASCPHWPAGKALGLALDETLRDFDALEERLEAKAVIALVGGTGTGKSSLANALCGRPNAVKPGIDRPTTRKASAIVRSLQDPVCLQGRFAADELNIIPVPETALPDAILIDTPDTDSNECESYSAVLDRVLENADVLLCVFDAQNPKKKDNLDRLAGYVRKFQPKHVVLVVNRSDIVSPGSLESKVIPDFMEHLKQCWPGSFEHVFHTSTVPAEGMVSSDNQLDELRDFLRKVTGVQFVDERLGRAVFLRESAEEGVRETLRGQGDWAALADEILSFEKNLSKRMAEGCVAGDGDTDAAKTSFALLRAASSLWWGPVGFFLGLSTRFRRAVETPLRASDLILPLALARRVRAFTSHDETNQGGNDDSFDTLRPCSWNDIPQEAIGDYMDLSDHLVGDFGMDPELRNAKASLVFDDLTTLLEQRWKTESAKEIRRSARRCSGLWLQLLLNACTIVPLVYTLWTIAKTFFKGEYLPEAFYCQSLALVGLLWLLTSWLVQVLLNRASKSVMRRTVEGILNGEFAGRILPVREEVETLARLAGH